MLQETKVLYQKQVVWGFQQAFYSLQNTTAENPQVWRRIWKYFKCTSDWAQSYFTESAASSL